MFSIEGISFFICYLAMGVLAANLVSRLYLKKLSFRAADLFLLALIAAGLTNNHIIIESTIFFGMLVSLFKEIVMFKGRKPIKVLLFLLLAINSCVLYYIQTGQGQFHEIPLAVVWLFVTMLMSFPILQTKQQEVTRLRNASFFHFIFRVASVLFIGRYLVDGQIKIELIYYLLSAFIILLCISIISRKIVFTKMISQAHVSAVVLMLGLSFPHNGLGLLLIISSLLYVIDSDSISLQSHNRRWLQMLEWPTWQSPAFILLILAVHEIKNAPLQLRSMFVVYVLLIGVVSVFKPEKINQDKAGSRQRDVVLTKSLLLIVATVVLEAWL
ncbi:MAG: hypothetical protein KDD37_07380 [Bdellovibrionales bacterium]|nr:hypothetical protein [Bdellovibrionales bacterium]